MKLKIHNKKGFFSGILLISLSAVLITLMIINGSKQLKTWKLVKDIILSFATGIIGFTSLKDSFSYKKTQHQKQENDEREAFIQTTAAKVALNLVHRLCFIFMLACIIIWHFTKIDELIGSVTAFGIIWTTICLIQIGTEIYYESKY